MSETVTKKNLCPHCGYLTDRATPTLREKRAVGPGDFSICLNCGNVCIFTWDMGLRVATAHDISRLSPDMQRHLLKARLTQRFVVGDRRFTKNERPQ